MLGGIPLHGEDMPPEEQQDLDPLDLIPDFSQLRDRDDSPFADSPTTQPGDSLRIRPPGTEGAASPSRRELGGIPLSPDPLDAIPVFRTEPEQKTVGGLIKNIGSSGVQAGIGLAAFAWDFTAGTLRGLIPGQPASNISQLLAGVTLKAIPGEQKGEEVAQAAFDFYKKRFGGRNAKEVFQNAVNTAYEDPVGFVLDASMFLGGLSAGARVGARAGAITRTTSRTARAVQAVRGSRGGGITRPALRFEKGVRRFETAAERAAAKLLQSSQAMDPIGLTFGGVNLATKPFRNRKIPQHIQDATVIAPPGQMQELVKEAGSKFAGMLNATDPNVIGASIDLFRQDPADPRVMREMKAFREAKYKISKPDDLLAAFEGAVNDLIDRRQTEYNAAKLGLELHEKIIDPSAFFREFNGAVREFHVNLNAPTVAERYVNSQLLGTDTKLLSEAIDLAIETGRKLGSNAAEKQIGNLRLKGGDYNAYAFDIYAQQVDNIWRATVDGTRARQFMTRLRRGAREVLREQVPGYVEMTKGYAEASAMLDGLRGFIKPNATQGFLQDAALRRMGSILSDNRPMAQDLFRRLDEISGRPLFAQLLGSQFRDFLPNLKAHAALGEDVVTIFGGRFNPLYMLALPAASPRAWGAFLEFTGMKARQVEILLNQLPRPEVGFPRDLVTPASAGARLQRAAKSEESNGSNARAIPRSR